METPEPSAAPLARIATIMVNAADAERVAGFWAALLGTLVSSRFDQFVWLRPAGPVPRSWPSSRSSGPRISTGT